MIIKPALAVFPPVESATQSILRTFLPRREIHVRFLSRSVVVKYGGQCGESRAAG